MRYSKIEQLLAYKARLKGSAVVKVAAQYTSQRRPKCGGIHKEYRHHHTHEYICKSCNSYRANDDLTGARNIYLLGTMYVSGIEQPKFDKLEPTAN